MSNLEVIFKLFTNSSHPEEVFGPLVEPKEVNLNKSYKYFAKLTHTDHNLSNAALAEECFKLLGAWKEKANEKLRIGAYGKFSKTSYSSSPKSVNIGGVELGQKLFDGDLSQIFIGKKGDHEVLVKIVNSHKNNDLMLNEFRNLQKIFQRGSRVLIHLPEILNSFEIKNSQGVLKRVNVFALPEDKFYTLEEVKNKYPQGLEGRHIAWMFNRIMSAIFAAHISGIVHGAIVPSNLLIDVEKHNVKLIDWCYSAEEGQKLKAIVPKYKDFYPHEVFRKTSNFGTDIYMAAKCLLDILHADAPYEIRGFLRYCCIENLPSRPQDVGILFHEFKETLVNLYGKPKFVELKM